MKRRPVVVMAIAAVVGGVVAGTAQPSAVSSGSTAADRCVRGEWRMSNAAANALLQSLIPSGNIRVSEGVLTAAFPRNGHMRYGSTHFVVTADGGALVLKGSATFIFEADWNTRAGRLVLDAGRSELVISKFQATKDGRTVTVSGPPPTIRRTPPGATPYTCNRTTLRWRVPVNRTWATFRRVS
jgi:hypothetical protein